MKSHALLLVNPAAGAGEPAAEAVAEAARDLGVDVHILEKGADPAQVARRSGAATLGVAGGDGSLTAVASAALATNAAFVCIPLGTRNHFARDLGLDCDDPVGALRAFADDAVEQLRIAAELAPAAGAIIGNYGLGLSRLGRFAEAVAQLERATQLAPDLSPV